MYNLFIYLYIIILITDGIALQLFVFRTIQKKINFEILKLKLS